MPQDTPNPNTMPLQSNLQTFKENPPLRSNSSEKCVICNGTPAYRDGSNIFPTCGRACSSKLLSASGVPDINKSPTSDPPNMTSVPNIFDKDRESPRKTSGRTWSLKRSMRICVICKVAPVYGDGTGIYSTCGMTCASILRAARDLPNTNKPHTSDPPNTMPSAKNIFDKDRKSPRKTSGPTRTPDMSIGMCMICKSAPVYRDGPNIYSTCGMACASKLRATSVLPSIDEPHISDPPNISPAPNIFDNSFWGSTRRTSEPTRTYTDSRSMEMCMVCNDAPVDKDGQTCGMACASDMLAACGPANTNKLSASEPPNGAFVSSAPLWNNMTRSLSLLNQTGMCDVCHVRPRSHTRGKIYPTCGLTSCLAKLLVPVKMCDCCKKRPKVIIDGKTNPYCGKTCRDKAKFAETRCILCRKSPKPGNSDFCSKLCKSLACDYCKRKLKAVVDGKTYPHCGNACRDKSKLAGINADSTSESDIVDIDKSEYSLTTTCWIAAEHALQHVRNNISSISDIFGRWKFQKSEYVVLAGFDESLIKSGVGYLEQIHVFVIAEVDATSPLLSELGRLFSPFSSILFTESSSYHLPVFKDDGSVWEFDELVYYTASKFADGGSSAKTPLTIISLNQSILADGVTGLSPSGSGSGDGEKNKKRKIEKGKERDTGDKDEANKHNKYPSDNPNGPPGDQDGIIDGPGISFNIASRIYLNEIEQNTSQTPATRNCTSKHEDDSEQTRNAFQTLTMCGELTIKTTPLAHDPPQYSERVVEFTELTFGTERTTMTDIAYKQFHLRIVVDSHQENAKFKTIKPRKTPHSDGEEKQLSSTKSGRTHDMRTGIALGPHPQATVTLNTTKTKEVSTSSEKKLFKSPISVYFLDGKIRWGFNIDDENFQEEGVELRKDELPTVRFEFQGESDEPESLPTPPPEYMDIAITSHWKLTLPGEPKHTWIRRLLLFFRSNGNTQAPSYFNLFQIVALKPNLSKLRKMCPYRANLAVDMDPGAASDPQRHEVKVTKKALEYVNVIPAVVDSDDPKKIIFSDEDESNPKKPSPSLPIRLPTIAKFRLSDDCIIWGNLDCQCDRSEATTTK